MACVRSFSTQMVAVPEFTANHSTSIDNEEGQQAQRRNKLSTLKQNILCCVRALFVLLEWSRAKAPLPKACAPRGHHTTVCRKVSRFYRCTHPLTLRLHQCTAAPAAALWPEKYFRRALRNCWRVNVVVGVELGGAAAPAAEACGLSCPAATEVTTGAADGDSVADAECWSNVAAAGGGDASAFPFVPSSFAEEDDFFSLLAIRWAWFSASCASIASCIK